MVSMVTPGIYAALVVPMFQNEEINYPALTKLVEWEIERGVEGLYVCGSSGEGLLLSVNERKQVLEKVMEATAGKVPVIAHTGTIRTDDVIELSQHAEKSGVTGVSMIPPYYYRFSNSEISAYYRDVMDRVNIPVIIYNIPAFTGITFNGAGFGELLSDKRIGGIKHTSTNMYDLERMKSAYSGKVFFNGYDEVFLSGLAAGADAAIGTTINLFPDIFKRIRSCFKAGENEQAALEQSKINGIVETFVDAGIFNAVKYSFTLLGIECGSCRKPFLSLDATAKKRIEKLIHQYF